ncbi:MAG: pyridine nucleotide-disulfide oxidoreductase, partial [Armatimonadetes bacterium CG07_land_8_20_14_0_80_40_9]
MSKVKINIDGQEVLAERGQTILEAAKKVGIDIPTLCQDDKLLPFGACRTCLVEVEGAKGPLPACATLVDEGMLVRTDTEEVRSLTELSLGLLVSDHYGDCLAPCTL